MSRSTSNLTRAIIVTLTALLLPSSGAVAEAPPAFNEAFSIAAGYHRQLSLLPARYQDQPETAAYEYDRLTAQALAGQLAIDVQPCFAKWWAHEYMGLELTALSHQLRTLPGDHRAEADLIERLGTRQWQEAMALVQPTGVACGAALQPTIPNVALVVAGEGSTTDER